MHAEVLEKVESCVSLANSTSKRKGQWSTTSEVAHFLGTEFGYVDINFTNLRSHLNELVRLQRVEKKTPELWRIGGGGAILFDSRAPGSGSPGGDYTPPEGDPGQNPRYPDDKWPQDYPQDDPNYRTTEGGGASAGGVGVAAPIPMPDISQLI